MGHVNPEGPSYAPHSVYLPWFAHAPPLQPGASGPALQRLAAELPRPKAIVVVSAHWESQELLVSGNAAPETWHDFGGFPAELFAVQYPAPGDPQLAREIVELLHRRWLECAHR